MFLIRNEKKYSFIILRYSEHYGFVFVKSSIHYIENLVLCNVVIVSSGREFHILIFIKIQKNTLSKITRAIFL